MGGGWRANPPFPQHQYSGQIYACLLVFCDQIDPNVNQTLFFVYLGIVIIQCLVLHQSSFISPNMYCNTSALVIFKILTWLHETHWNDFYLSDYEARDFSVPNRLWPTMTEWT